MAQCSNTEFRSRIIMLLLQLMNEVDIAMSLASFPGSCATMSHEQKEVLPAEHIIARVLQVLQCEWYPSVAYNSNSYTEMIKSITNVRHTCYELLRVCAGKKMACAIRWEVPTILPAGRGFGQNCGLILRRGGGASLVRSTVTWQQCHEG